MSPLHSHTFVILSKKILTHGMCPNSRWWWWWWSSSSSYAFSFSFSRPSFLFRENFIALRSQFHTTHHMCIISFLIHEVLIASCHPQDCISSLSFWKGINSLILVTHSSSRSHSSLWSLISLLFYYFSELSCLSSFLVKPLKISDWTIFSSSYSLNNHILFLRTSSSEK